MIAATPMNAAPMHGIVLPLCRVPCCGPFPAVRRWQVVREMGTGTIDFTVLPVASLRRDGASPRFAAADPAL